MSNKCKRGYKRIDGKCVSNSSYFGKKNSINWNAMWIFITIFGILLIVGTIFYGGNKGWFKSLTVIEDTDLISYLNTPEEVIDSSCSLAFSPNSIYVGDRTTGTIIDGKNSFCQVFANDGIQWVKVFEGYTNEDGVLVNTRNINTVGDFIFRAICDRNNNNRVDIDDCLTNQADLSVIPKNPEPEPTPEGYEVGDVVGGGSESGIISGTSDSWQFDLSDVAVGGSCYLGVRLNTQWDYANNKCSGIQGAEGLIWAFSDSSGIVYQNMEISPQSNSIELCPLNWDGTHQWKLEIEKLIGLPECQMSYAWDAEIFVCECN
jgi:hypothetical protein